MPETYLALLRAINVGGRNKLPMKDLAAMFVEAGCENVRTYIQSGNVIFAAEPEVAAQVPVAIAAKIASAYGYRMPVVLRSSEQLIDVISHNPFLEAGVSEDALHVMFLADAPSQSLIDRLDPDRSPSGVFTVRNQDIYLHLPNGVAESKLTNAYFDSKLRTVSTVRNWRTVTKLRDLMNVGA
jgi:uncharacterized protein (DUF1697 family)